MTPLAAIAAALGAVIGVAATVTPPSDPVDSSIPTDSAPGSSVPDDSAPSVTVDVSKTIPGVPPTIPGSAPDGASIDQLVAASETMLGPTTDIVGQFAQLLDVPEGIPTPAGTTIIDFSFWIEPDDDPTYSNHGARVSFTSTATPDDLADFWETLLPAAGFTQTGDSTSSDENGRLRVLDFDNPTAVYDMADISITINEAGTDGEPAIHEIWWYGDADMAALTPFLGWLPGLPLPDDARAIEASIRRSSFLDIGSVTVDVLYELPTTDPATAQSELEGALPLAEFALDPESDTADSTELTGPGIEQLSIYWSERYAGGTLARVSGRVVV